MPLMVDVSVVDALFPCWTVIVDGLLVMVSSQVGDAPPRVIRSGLLMLDVCPSVEC